jgi:hypothetical protein
MITTFLILTVAGLLVIAWLLGERRGYSNGVRAVVQLDARKIKSKNA